MKNLLAAFVLIAVSVTSALAQTTKPSAQMKCVMPVDTFKGTRHTRVLTITPKCRKTYLDSVAAAWAKDSIILTFTKMKYSLKGNVVSVAGSVVINVKGGKASGSFECNRLQSEEIKVIDGWSVSVSGNTKQ